LNTGLPADRPGPDSLVDAHLERAPKSSGAVDGSIRIVPLSCGSLHCETLMALVKAARITGTATPAVSSKKSEPATASELAARTVTRQPSGTRHAQASERIAAATEQLASGLTEASAAAEEVRRSMEQIASGADEAAGASREQLAAIESIVANLGAARTQSETTHRRTEAVEAILGETAAQITTSVRAIERNADRQRAASALIAELDRRARDIGEITRTVSEISDQTNLLALNAAIEAARAGDHGRGFAVVAEEVRALAETSEKSAQEVRDLAEAIQEKVREVVETAGAAAAGAVAEAKAGLAVVDSLEATRQDMTQLAGGSQDTLTAAVEAERAAVEAQRGAQQIARAAEEQSAAAAEAQTAIQQQVGSLDQSQTAAQALAGLAEQLRAGRADVGAPQQIGAAAEQLSATVQELSGASSEIMAAVEEINRGAEQQSAAAQQISAALSHIQNSATIAQRNAQIASERVTAMQTALHDSRSAVEKLAEGVAGASQQTEASVDLMRELETVGRRIDKLVDAIALVAVQTTMLAVSGAVEAARAGDAGRGFAVVSNDIRSLARETSQSMDRVKDTVRSIIDQVVSVQRDLQQIKALSEAEVEKNRSISEALARMDSDVAALRTANAVILQGADAILAAFTQVAQGARQIAAAAEQSSRASREAASASAEQAQGAEDLAAAIEEIASLADEIGRPSA
jgi:methyl-accepting chemotaxis protein